MAERFEPNDLEENLGVLKPHEAEAVELAALALNVATGVADAYTVNVTDPGAYIRRVIIYLKDGAERGLVRSVAFTALARAETTRGGRLTTEIAREVIHRQIPRRQP